MQDVGRAPAGFLETHRLAAQVEAMRAPPGARLAAADFGCLPKGPLIEVSEPRIVADTTHAGLRCADEDAVAVDVDKGALGELLSTAESAARPPEARKTGLVHFGGVDEVSRLHRWHSTWISLH